MLAQLTIRNFALIGSLTLEFVPGFNVFTGETGAGKSILIDAITAALGERAGAELVRAGADRALIEAVFEVDESFPPGALEWAEEGVVILGREISASGRSGFRVNGRLSTAGTVRPVAADLIDIHGQHDHQSLLSSERHVEFLDAWAGREVLALRRRAQELLGTLRAAQRELDRLQKGERQQAQQLDLFRFQLGEIEAAGLDVGEETELLRERTRLSSAERLRGAAAAAREALDGGEPSAVDRLSAAGREVEAIAALDPRAEPIRELLESALVAAQEAAGELRGYLEGIEANPERLDQIQERLDVYRSLKRKYGDTVAEVLAYHARLLQDLDQIEHFEELREKLEAEVIRLVSVTEREAAALFRARQQAAARFEQEIAGHLGDLNMAGTRFAVQLAQPEPAGDGGRPAGAILGRAEFLLSANPGEPLRPLARIASGGEMSRVMLALKSVMAGSHPLALIFDEIDTGVGGKTAESLGRKMHELSSSNQVLCVTHLPQIACMAARHFLVRKEIDGDRTQVRVELLDGEARVGELARMLGGSHGTAAQHARELLAAASGSRLVP